jgi:hypothetical protein
MLLSAGVSGDALIPVDANDGERVSALAAASAILCDVYTASLPSLPKKPKRFVFPLLAESADSMLRAFEPSQIGRAGVVTPSKVS